MNVALKWGHMKRHAGFIIEWVFTRANSSEGTWPFKLFYATETARDKLWQ